MPAIQPARLKHQTAQLAECFEQPDRFVRTLHDLLNAYSDHTQRPGQGGEPTALLDSYRVPQPVLREIFFALKPLIRDKPEATLNLCQRLWKEPNLEFRVIASTMLGQVEHISAKKVMELVHEWLEEEPEDHILWAVLDHALAHIRHEQPALLIDVIKDWLSNKKLFYVRCGLWALLFLGVDVKFPNLPEVFHLLTPFIRSVPRELSPDIQNILWKLAKYAPEETAFVLRQLIDQTGSPDTAWLIRQVIHEFPRSIQDSLRQSLKST